MIDKIRAVIGQKGGFGKAVRYMLVGVSAAAVDFAVFWLIFLLLGKNGYIFGTEPEKIANAAAVITGFFYSFILNRRWAFKSKKNAALQLFMMLCLLLLNTFISGEAVSFMGRNTIIPFAAAKLIMQAAVAVWNYFIYDKIIYRS